MENHNQHTKLSLAGLLISIGIIYGDIGTSPLYVMGAVVGKQLITEELILGALSCVIWTLTLQTTIKYVFLALQADNNGEGGIFSLFTLVRNSSKWLYIPAIIGGAMLLADGMITPPISVASAIEGLEIKFPGIKTVPIVMVIISILFFFQRFGTAVVGKFFGPIMVVWFSMLAILGLSQIFYNPIVFKAFNPYYAFNLLTNTPGGFWLLGAIFLCTTGAESVYSDLGHCGKQNIRISWIFVKTTLILNYLGQGAWLLQLKGQPLTENPFYGVMPEWFLPFGIAIATMAAIIASQALITGSFTVISEAIRLNLFPKVTVKYPSDSKGQIFVPSINFILWLGCLAVVWYFQKSKNMEDAYGLAITLTMLMTTILLFFFLKDKVNSVVVTGFILLYITTEGSFFVANAVKFFHGGYVPMILALIIVLLMYIWLRGSIIKRRLTDYVKINDYLDQLTSLSKDETVPKFATHLIFMSTSAKDDEVEQKVLYSILQKQPKRADIYWFVHIEVTNEPYTMEYKVNPIVPEDVIKVKFRLGFRVEQRMNLYLRKVIEDMVKNKEIDVVSRYHSLREKNVAGDFRFIIIEEFLSYENDLNFSEQFIMNTVIAIKSFTASPEKWFGLDTSSVVIEKVPLVIRPISAIKLKRIFDNQNTLESEQENEDLIIES